MSLRPGTLVKHLHLDEKFADSELDSGATFSVDEEASRKEDETGTFRYY